MLELNATSHGEEGKCPESLLYLPAEISIFALDIKVLDLASRIC